MWYTMELSLIFLENSTHHKKFNVERANYVFTTILQNRLFKFYQIEWKM